MSSKEEKNNNSRYRFCIRIYLHRIFVSERQTSTECGEWLKLLMFVTAVVTSNLPPVDHSFHRANDNQFPFHLSLSFLIYSFLLFLLFYLNSHMHIHTQPQKFICHFTVGIPPTANDLDIVCMNRIFSHCENHHIIKYLYIFTIFHFLLLLYLNLV